MKCWIFVERDGKGEAQVGHCGKCKSKKVESSRLWMAGEDGKSLFVEEGQTFLIVVVLMARCKLWFGKAFIGVEQGISGKGIMEVLGSVGDGWERPDVKCDALIFAGSLDSKEAEVAVL